MSDTCKQFIPIKYQVSVNNLKKMVLSLSIHYQNTRQFATKMFEVSKGLCLQIVIGLFQFRYNTPYNLRRRSQIHIPAVRTVFSGA